MEDDLSEALDTRHNSANDNGAQAAPGAPRDAFAKAHSFNRAELAEASGLHPYFKPIAAQHGGTVLANGREMVITGSNDYLGLTQDDRLKQAARAALDTFGTSCTGSR
ncbi:MAG: hypothetical protein P8Z81_15860, partial [Deinococcales bacterium]